MAGLQSETKSTGRMCHGGLLLATGLFALFIIGDVSRAAPIQAGEVMAPASPVISRARAAIREAARQSAEMALDQGDNPPRDLCADMLSASSEKRPSSLIQAAVKSPWKTENDNENVWDSPKSLPPHDRCENAIPLTVGETYHGSSSGALTEVSGILGSADVWHEFMPAQSGVFSFSLCGSSFDTVLTLFTGACNDLTRVFSNDDSVACGMQSHFCAWLEKDRRYYLRVAGYDGASGDYALYVTAGCSETALDNCPDSPVMDGGFEVIVNNPWWETYSDNFDTVLYSEFMGESSVTVPYQGNAFLWFGGIVGTEESGYARQRVVIPESHGELRFFMKVQGGLTPGWMRVQLDGNLLFEVTHEDVDLYWPARYKLVTLDISAYADSEEHLLGFESFTAAGDSALNFLVDAVCITAEPISSPEYIEIGSIEALQRIGFDDAYPLDGHYRLVADIDASATATWNDGAGFNPLGVSVDGLFNGVLDGQGHIIRNLTINRPEMKYVGLLGTAYQALIKNLILENVSITGKEITGALSGFIIQTEVIDVECRIVEIVANDWAGGLSAMAMRSSVRNCRAAGIVRSESGAGGLIAVTQDTVISNCHSEGAVAAAAAPRGNAGGIAGVFMASFIKNCHASATIMGTIFSGGMVGTATNASILVDSTAVGDVTGNDGMGAFLGAVSDHDVTVLRCLGVGDVRGDTAVGGFVGVARGSQFTDCEATGNAFGVFNTGGFAGEYISDQLTGIVQGCVASGAVHGVERTGGFAGTLQHIVSVENCHARGEVYGNTFTGGFVGYLWNTPLSDLSVSGAIYADYYSGGLAGYAGFSSLTRCRSTAFVIGGTNVGGLVGAAAESSIEKSYAAGVIVGRASVGGLVGEGAGLSFSECYVAGPVQGEVSVGGILGLASGPCNAEAVFWDIESTGANTSEVGQGKTTAEMMQRATYIEAGWSFQDTAESDALWRNVEEMSYPYFATHVDENARFQVATTASNSEVLLSPRHAEYRPYTLVTLESTPKEGHVFAGWAGDGLSDTIELTMNPIALVVTRNMRITGVSLRELVEISALDVLQQIGNTPEHPRQWQYRLTGDIDAGETVHWNDGAGFKPLGGVRFTGTFDGNGYTITGLYINRPYESHIGLFGRVFGEITNVVVRDASVNGMQYVGALAGVLRGSATGCRVEGIAAQGDTFVGCLAGYLFKGDYADCHAEGHASGTMNVGVLSGGIAQGTLRDASAQGSAHAIQHTCGGLIGFVYDAAIETCRAESTVTGATTAGGLLGSMQYSALAQSYATATVSDGIKLGGLVGELSDNSRITTSYAVGAVSGEDMVGGLVGSIKNGVVSDCFSLVQTTGYQYVGGLVGLLDGGGTERSFAAGRVLGVANAGGLVGYVESGNCAASFWDAGATGMLQSACGQSKASQQMLRRTTFTSSGWDFARTWTNVNCLTYPWLRALPCPYGDNCLGADACEGEDIAEGEGEGGAEGEGEGPDDPCSGCRGCARDCESAQENRLFIFLRQYMLFHWLD